MPVPYTLTAMAQTSAPWKWCIKSSLFHSKFSVFLGYHLLCSLFPHQVSGAAYLPAAGCAVEVGTDSAACPWPAGMAVGPAPLEMPAAQEGSNSSREDLNWVEASCAFKVQWCSEYLWWIWKKVPFLFGFFFRLGYWLHLLLPWLGNVFIPQPGLTLVTPIFKALSVLLSLI